MTPKKDECSTEARIELARLDERIKGLQREIEHTEAQSSNALKLAAEELARRLETLNHAHQQEIEKSATFASRELVGANMKEVSIQLGVVEERVKQLELEFREQRGRLWLPMIAAAALAATVTAAVVKLAFP